MTAQMRRRQAPGWDRVHEAAAQHGIELTAVRETDTHILYEAHWVLKALHDAGHAVGPVATHNFDRLFARASLPEAFMRRYDQRTPHMEYPPEARSLLVVGLHADRRSVQQRARELGLRVFFVDTEGITENGVHKEYLIEGARAGDVIVRSEAIPALRRLAELLKVEY
ncbi:hypothetical protein [Streptosporangium pseudovulgare]|uniref:hypothetical protein n=1 Tax=Streptosporangium pseudovulgare TaxID=35765 RepID=UPI00166FD8E9|nr:hypothetical protein [Streptosporangium pseudovulgare]